MPENVTVRTGDLLGSNAQTLVNTVNCVGVMGKGIALEFKKRFPEMFTDYVNRCRRGEVKLGQPYVFRQLIGPWVINFPTKNHWRDVASLADIERGLDFLADHIAEWQVTSIAVPPLGCGNGQLEWRLVGPTLYRRLNGLGIPVELYAPYDTPHEELRPEFFGERASALRSIASPEMHVPDWGVALVEILRRVEAEPYHWPVGRTKFQKLGYFATALGLPTGLEFTRNSYGPYEPSLARLLARLQHHGLVTSQQAGKMNQVTVGPTFDDARRVHEARLEEWGPVLERIVDLFVRLQSTRQAELAATAMHVAREATASGKIPSHKSVVDGVLEWKRRSKPAVSAADVVETVEELAAHGWLRVDPSERFVLADDEAMSREWTVA